MNSWMMSNFLTAVDLKGSADTETGYFCSNQSKIEIQMRAEDRHAKLVYLCWSACVNVSECVNTRLRSTHINSAETYASGGDIGQK